MISFVSKHAEMTEGLKNVVNFVVDLCALITARATIIPFSINTCIKESIQQMIKKEKSALFNVWQREFKKSDPVCMYGNWQPRNSCLKLRNAVSIH